MSTVQVTTLQDRATLKSLGVERVIEGTAKSWVRVIVASGVPSNVDSFNVSSIVDTALGQCTINLSSGMANTYYGVPGAVSRGSCMAFDPSQSNASTFVMRAILYSNVVDDPTNYNAVVLGDLA